MAAFYELGSLHVIEQTFIQGYVRSIIRSSHLPPPMRTLTFDPDALAQALTAYINTGQGAASSNVRAFLHSGTQAA